MLFALTRSEDLPTQIVHKIIKNSVSFQKENIIHLLTNIWTFQEPCYIYGVYSINRSFYLRVTKPFWGLCQASSLYFVYVLYALCIFSEHRRAALAPCSLLYIFRSSHQLLPVTRGQCQCGGCRPSSPGKDPGRQTAKITERLRGEQLSSISCKRVSGNICQDLIFPYKHFPAGKEKLLK